MDSPFRSTDKAQNSSQGTGPGPDTAPASPPLPYILPPESALFLHREAELAWLDAQLCPEQVVGICGPTGMGKSALAARAVRALPAHRFPDGIILHSYEHQAETSQALRGIARALHLPLQGDLRQELAQALETRQVLLILDRAEKAEDLQALLRLRGSCGLLIISRQKSDCGPLRLDLAPLPAEQAKELLQAWAKGSRDEKAVGRICRKLGGWPLALRLAGCCLQRSGERATDYLRWLEQEPLQAADSSEDLLVDNVPLLLRRSIGLLSRDSRLVLRLAGCLAFAPLHPAPITALLEGDKGRGRKAINELVQYGLLERRGQGLHISHALIYEYVAKHLPLNCETLERMAWYYIFLCKAQTLTKAPGPVCLDSERTQCLRLLTACLENGLWLEVQTLARALDRSLEQQDCWPEELAAWEMRLIAAQQAGDRRDEAWCLSNLGYCCLRHREEEQALHWFRQCLPLWRELDTCKDAIAMPRPKQTPPPWKQAKETQARAGKGASREKQSEYDKALDHLQDALNTRKELGPEASRAQSFWNLGLAYEGLGDLVKAEKYITQAVELAECIEYPWVEKWREGLEQMRNMRQVRKAARSRQRQEALQRWLRFLRPWRRDNS